MNRFKIYLRTKGNIEEQAATYAQVFEGKILKHMNIEKSSQWSFAYLEIVHNLNLILARHYETMPTFGYQADHVINLKTKASFDQLYQNLIENPNFKLDYKPTAYNWGTTITKFYDRWGYGWILETANK